MNLKQLEYYGPEKCHIGKKISLNRQKNENY